MWKQILIRKTSLSLEIKSFLEKRYWGSDHLQALIPDWNGDQTLNKFVLSTYFKMLSTRNIHNAIWLGGHVISLDLKMLNFMHSKTKDSECISSLYSRKVFSIPWITFGPLSATHGNGNDLEWLFTNDFLKTYRNLLFLSSDLVDLIEVPRVSDKCMEVRSDSVW